MKNKLYWVVALLIVLLIAGMCYMLAGQYAAVREYEKAAAAAEKLLAEHNKQKQTSGSIGVDVADDTYQPPPPGETDDTGYWEGNTWHKTAPPKPPKSWQQESDNDLYSKALSEGHLDYAEVKEALRYYPESPLLLSMRARDEMFWRPEEAILYAKKALRNLPTHSEDYSNLGIMASPSMNAHFALRMAYQKIGDYKSALVHLRKTQSLVKPGLALDSPEGALARLTYECCSDEIAAIKAGKPLLGPDPKPEPSSVDPLPVYSETDSESSAPVNVPLRVDMSDVPPKMSADMELSGAESSLFAGRSNRPEAFAEGEHASILRRQQEHFDFVQWLETVEQAKSPADLDNFLMREMAKNLLDGQSEFTPDRLIRAFELMHRHGEREGRIALEKRDAALAREMARQDRNRSVPPKPRNPPK